MSRYNRLFILISFAILSSACSGFLDEKDKSNFTVENYFTKPEHALSITNASYSSLKAITGGGFAGSPWLMLEFATGLAGTELGQATSSIFVKDLINNSDNIYGNTYWISSYRGIANTNLAISKIPNISMDENIKNKYLGEVHFLRAYYYFNLVRIFGKIPLITTEVDLRSPELHPKQAEIADVYKLIVTDLQKAEKSGLPLTEASGRVSLAAVKTLLSTVYLTMAGYPLKAGQEYYEKAYTTAKELVTTDAYKLFNTYLELHDPNRKNLTEHIFMAQFAANLQPGDWQTSIIPYNGGISVYADQTGAIFANKSFIDSYETGDLRVQEKQFYYQYYTLASDRTKTINLGNYFIYKLFDIEAQEKTARSNLNWPLLRYAEVLLNLAEAANETNKNLNDAYQAVNLIRTRAQLPTLQNLSQEQLREAILKERWYELSFENKTWFDMSRLRLAFNLTTKKFEPFIGHKFSYGPTLTARELLFPIPTAEIRNNTNLIQNDGY